MVQPIKFWPSPILTKKILWTEEHKKELAEWREELKQDSEKLKEIGGTAKDMIDTMIAAKAVGIAANQIGEEVRFIAIFDEKLGSILMVNPIILEFSDDYVEDKEGCLSVPQLFVEMKRAKLITVKWFDERAEEQAKEFTGGQARAIQHEVDHLDGKCIIQEAGILGKAKWNMQQKKALRNMKKARLNEARNRNNSQNFS